jgi:hypothetical protein
VTRVRASRKRRRRKKGVKRLLRGEGNRVLRDAGLGCCLKKVRITGKRPRDMIEVTRTRAIAQEIDLS